MANHVYIATSLDGYIATEDGGLDWLFQIPNPGGDDFGYSDFITRIDAIVMGRATFEKVLTFGRWPYELPVFVLSGSVTELPTGFSGDPDMVEFISGEPAEVVRNLNEQGFEDLYIDGGVTITRFLAADLIDRLIITRLPVILGRGIPLFGHLDLQLWFEHRKTEILHDTAVKSWYVRKTT